MTMHNTRTNGWEQGRKEGRVAEAAQVVLTALRARGFTVPDAVRERILAEKDLERLRRWHEKVVVAASVEEAIDALS